MPLTPQLPKAFPPRPVRLYPTTFVVNNLASARQPATLLSEPRLLGTITLSPLVGEMVNIHERSWIAYRSPAYGGSERSFTDMAAARRWIEGACNQQLRQKQEQMTSGPILYRFYLPSVLQAS